MDTRPSTAPDQMPLLDTADIYDRFVVTDLFQEGKVSLTYAMEDRMILGGVLPGSGEVKLEAPAEVRSEFFCERRELGVVNVGTADGKVVCDGTDYTLKPKEVLYVGRGTKDVTFSGDTALYLASATAHAEHPTTHVSAEEAAPIELGDIKTSNERTIRKYIHADGAASCQLVLGVTDLAEGSMWNTMPAHVHDRRTECYLYFGLPEDQRVVHMMGEPQETRHVILSDKQAVISPAWSIHCGFGTSSYSFVWAMAGENLDYTDVEPAPITALR
ncbi:5-dehydro-4-deoxy-D-glucuronate isomerase [Mariniluteicoccus endophyticus]